MTMHFIFPYASKPVSITQNMCDHNGHMNVLFYSQIFGESMDDFYAGTLGFSGEYFDSGFSSFSLEDNIKYVKECLLDEIIVTRYRLHRVNKKLIHLTAVMLNEEDQLCAIYETILGHSDMKSRKTAPMAGPFFDNLYQIMEEHNQREINIPLRLQIKEI